MGALAREERGQSLVVIVIAMTLIVAVAALAIDASSWFAKHHQAQVTADAAALAAANYMGTAIAAGTAPATASPTGTTTAVSYASRNGLPISSGNVTIDTGGQTVTVTVPTTGSLFFAGISLGSGPSISAHATASWKIQDCTSAGSDCAFAYAADNVCSGNTGVTSSAGTTQHGITISKSGTGNNGGVSITGDVVSASNITLNVNGNPQFTGSAAYSNATGCLPSSPSSLAPPFANAYKEAIKTEYPIDYRTIYPACPGRSSLFGPVTCVQDPNNSSVSFPSYCTAADDSTSSALTLSSVNNNDVYCDAGSGTTTDPSTWNGTITVTAGGQGGTLNATYLAGAVNLQIPSNTTNVGPAAGNKLLAYGAECNATTPPLSFCPATATATTTPAISITTTGNSGISGDFFAPGGVIDAAMGGNPTLTGFLEGWDVVYNAHGTVIGEGPPVNNLVQFVGDYLIQ